MYSLIESQPSAIRRLGGSTMFYFGSQTVETHLLSGKMRFEVVHSPTELYGWEFVRYETFEARDGVLVLERRVLEPDEIAYFEKLLTLSAIGG